MSITQITEREQQLTHYLAEMTKALELMRQERDRLDTNLKSWLRANGPEGWIDDLRIEADKLAAENKTLRDAWSAEPVGYISEHEKDSAMDKFRYLPSKMYPTPVYTRNQS
jgi:hypothetical protein